MAIYRYLNQEIVVADEAGCVLFWNKEHELVYSYKTSYLSITDIYILNSKLYVIGAHGSAMMLTINEIDDESNEVNKVYLGEELQPENDNGQSRNSMKSTQEKANDFDNFSGLGI